MATGYSFPTGVADGFQVELENGVTYEFKAEFQRWDVVKGTGNSVWITDELPDDNYVSNGDLWFDNTADTMQLFLWHEESGAWLPVAPPTTLEGRVDAGEATQAAIIEQIQKSLSDQADLAERITAGETEQSTLKNKVNALEGVVGEHSLVFTMDNSNPRPGEFNLKDGAMQVTNTLASADYITLSDTDGNGNAINLDRITEGDVLRFSSVDGLAAEIKITDGTNGVYAFTKVSGELDRLSDMPYQFILLSSFDPAGLATVDYVDAQDDTKLNKSGGTITGSLNFNRGNKPSPQFRISPNSGDNYATNIYAMNNGELRLRSSGTDKEGDHVGSHIVLQANDDAPTTKIYHVPEPTQPHMAASKEYVDDKIAAIPAPSGIPVGCIMIWINSDVPDGWLKLHGASFDINEYPELHAYLEGTNGYISGTLPDWSGHYPGEYGDHLSASYPALGKKVGHMTAMPAGEAPYHPNAIPNGNTRTFNATGGTNAYSDGKARPAITEGWDSTTRPKTVIVHYIIKAKP